MKGLFRTLQRNDGGFTLVELIIAIAIIGILTSIIVLNASGLVSNVETSPAESKTVPPSRHTTTGQTDLTTGISSMDTIENQVDLETIQLLLLTIWPTSPLVILYTPGICAIKQAREGILVILPGWLAR